MTPASSWEYRYKFLILIVSQPVLAFLGSRAFGVPGLWYAPEFETTTAAVAVALGLVGCLLRLCGVSTLTSEIMASQNPDTRQLMTAGLFGVVRNPLYLGTIILFTAYGLFFDWRIAVAFAAFHWIRYDRVVRFEETMLAADWGDAYRNYCATVPRWLPRFRTLELKSVSIRAESLWTNAMFIGVWTGLVASALTGSLVALIPFEVVGTLVMGLHFMRAGRSEGSLGQGDEAIIEIVTLDTESDARKVA